MCRIWLTSKVRTRACSPSICTRELRPVDLLDRGQLAVGNVQVAIGSGELDTVPLSELAFALAVGGDALQASGIIGDLLAVVAPNRQQDCPSG